MKNYFLFIFAFILFSIDLNAQSSFWSSAGPLTIPPSDNIKSTNVGNVGIGIDAPLSKLHVNNKILVSQLEMDPRLPIGFKNSDDQFKTSEAVFQLSALSSRTLLPINTQHNINSMFNGSVTLKVSANHKEELRLFTVNVESPDMPIVFSHESTERLRIEPNGNVGLGTDKPNSKLHVLGDTEIEGNLKLSTKIYNGRDDHLNIYSNTSAQNSRSWIQLWGNHHTRAGELTLAGDNVTIWSGSSKSSYGSERIRINNEGYVGIGTRNPLSILDVNGTTTTKILTIKGGSDIAEPFLISKAESGEIIPGSVVIIDQLNPGRLKLSEKEYDRKVVGVVSGANGIRSGLVLYQNDKFEKGENVAISGRVYVRANNSNGNIEPGDFLTTSNVSGEAMKVTDATNSYGAVIGKAMTGLNEDNGLVLIFITLQ